MVSGQDRRGSGSYPVFGAVAEFARSCAKSRRCRRGGGSSRRRDRRQLSQEIFTAPLVFDAWLVSLKGMELMYALPCPALRGIERLA